MKQSTLLFVALLSLTACTAKTDAQWPTFSDPNFGFSIDYPADWKTIPGQGVVGFYPPSSQDMPLGDAPSSSSLMVTVSSEKLQTYIKNLDASENDGCLAPTQSTLHDLPASYVRCTAVWDGQLWDHYIAQQNGKVFDVWSMAEDGDVDSIYTKMRASFVVFTK